MHRVTVRKKKIIENKGRFISAKSDTQQTCAACRSCGTLAPFHKSLFIVFLVVVVVVVVGLGGCAPTENRKENISTNRVSVTSE